MEQYRKKYIKMIECPRCENKIDFHEDDYFNNDSLECPYCYFIIDHTKLFFLL